MNGRRIDEFRRKDVQVIPITSTKVIVGFMMWLLLVPVTYAETGLPCQPAGRMSRPCCPPPQPPAMVPGGRWGLEGPPGLNPVRQSIEELKLDEKQNEAVKEIENHATKELIQKRAAAMIAEIEFGELVEKESVDLNSVETKIREIAEIRAQIQMIIIRSREAIKAQLTSSQREKLKGAGFPPPAPGCHGVGGPFPIHGIEEDWDLLDWVGA
jgi:Spy/CpxP family protein refolding chaperone